MEDLDKKLDEFLGEETNEEKAKVIIDNDRSIIEVVNKKYITTDGKQLLNESI